MDNDDRRLRSFHASCCMVNEINEMGHRLCIFRQRGTTFKTYGLERRSGGMGLIGFSYFD